MDECHCPYCYWSGTWEDCRIKVSHELYGEAFGSPVHKEEYTYYCPLCGEEVKEGSLPTELKDDEDEDDEALFDLVYTDKDKEEDEELV